MSINNLRSRLRAEYGSGNYRIGKDGVVRVRGTGIVAWRKVGTVGKGKFRPPRKATADPIGRQKRTLYLYDVDVRRAQIMGNGNISRGVRRALEIAAGDVT
jgi:hypothetical protein